MIFSVATPAKIVPKRCNYDSKAVLCIKMGNFGSQPQRPYFFAGLRFNAEVNNIVSDLI